MNPHRKGESGSVPFRSGRFFNIDNNWYFSCREGRDLGPFENREQARAALENYLAEHHSANDTDDSARSETN